MKPLPWPVVLASASPRRHELLRQLVPEFTIQTADVDETLKDGEDLWVYAQRLAKEKALEVASQHPDALVIGGDTVVALPDGDDWIHLAKPVDKNDACRMLAQLSGKTHTVITGVCLRWPAGLSAFTESTKVTFRRLSASEIEEYVEGGEPMDKAGAYGAQGEAKAFLERIEGSLTCVIGLPIERLEEALSQIRKS
jgi:septum formation protein